jgi:hypothetical protein
MNNSIVGILFLLNISLGGKIGFEKDVVRADGIGNLKIGMTPIEASQQAGFRILKADSLTKSDSECFMASLEGQPDEIKVMVEKGHITRIDIHSKKFQTVDGLRIGDGESKIKKKYTGIFKEEQHPYILGNGKVIFVNQGNGNGFLFETENGKIIEYQVGDTSSIQYREHCL